MKNMKLFITFFLVASAAVSFADGAAPSSPNIQPLDTTVVVAPQKWRNAIELQCRRDKEIYEIFQSRINTRLSQIGGNGWEMVSVSYSPFQGKDCLVLGFRQPVSS